MTEIITAAHPVRNFLAHSHR